MKTTTYLSYNGTVTKIVTDRPEPTREEMAECARIIRATAKAHASYLSALWQSKKGRA